MTSIAAQFGTQILAGARAGWEARLAARARGALVALFGTLCVLAFATYNAADPSWNAASGEDPRNLLGGFGARLADLWLQPLGLAAWPAAIFMVLFGLGRLSDADPDSSRRSMRLRALSAAAAVVALAGALSAPQPPAAWPLARGLGGFFGDGLLHGFAALFDALRLPGGVGIATVLLLAAGVTFAILALGLTRADFAGGVARLAAVELWLRERFAREAPEEPVAAPAPKAPRQKAARKGSPAPIALDPEYDDEDEADVAVATPVARAITPPAARAAPAEPKVLGAKAPKPKGPTREERENQGAFEFVQNPGFQLPELAMLAKPKPRASMVDESALRQNARLLESVLAEFGVRGQIDQIRPGPVVTLYELVPAAGVKSARVVALSDDIARSMSARACRVSVVQGRNAIGIELPNQHRETVYLRDLLSSTEFDKSGHVLPLALGETIGGEPYIADLARMPHLLIAGTTGSGKSVGVNAMILSILYRLPPEQCRFIMIDPKMLELSVYDGIPHLLAPVVTDPKKAVVALKWTVREMEDRYRRMSKIGVRNVASYNERAREAASKGEHFERTVQTGFDDSGKAIYESEKIRPEPMPYLVVVVDEVADLMMVAGKDIEGAVQRLAQMARAAGIHLIMATQRPSVDVITGTIKANFPTRISFQVTSKIDSRTILGEQGAEQLLGQGDMLYMAGGGRITRLHGPFVADGEVESVASFLRLQGEPQYLEEVTAAPEEDEGGDDMYGGGEGSGDDLYDRAVAVVTRDRKASTSYIQRRLQIGYNRAASLIERMEQEGVVGPANHAGKRDILAGPPPAV
jgi:S-DNA-T family DNA segregation ATPase FtsK/SpoIIIE